MPSSLKHLNPVVGGKKWNENDFPFESNYNDHFETPLVAYQDILPLLKLIQSHRDLSNSRDNPQKKRKHNKKDSALILYDPYYCNGRAKVLLQQIGFENVIHEKRDFYRDMEQEQVPRHHVLITNPPYSDLHKQKCLEFCLTQATVPFFLLMPNYVASRNYFREAVTGSATHDMIYLVPSGPYQYEHPQGTGHDKSPFQSLWYCGLPKRSSVSMEAVRRMEENDPTFGGKLVFTWSSLMQNQGLSLKRPNPRQRKRKRAKTIADEPNESLKSPKHDSTRVDQPNDDNRHGSKRKESKYRDKDGSRKRKRF